MKGYLPHISYDSVVFGFAEEQLKILIMEYHNTGYFALPGGFVLKDENLNKAVKRGLKERTGLERIYLEQFYTFGSVERHQPEIMKTVLEANKLPLEEYGWMMERFVSVAYYALIDYSKVNPTPDALSDSVGWYKLDQLPNLVFNHQEIVKKALETLRLNLDRKLISANLLPPQFTMKELQKVHEAILGEQLRRSSFQRKMLSLNILKRHEKRFNGKAHKAPYLYSFVEQ
jgi:ADP-ribose pyrophosphatase YjhB (NUDIX family)